MHAISMSPVSLGRNERLKFTGLRILLLFALLDGLSAWLLILLYLTGIDLVWLVNVNFASMAALLMLFAFRNLRISYLILLFGAALFVSVVKIALYLDDTREFEWIHFLTYAQGLLMPFAALCFGSQFTKEDSVEILNILNRYARAFLWLALPGILTYSVLYFLGRISYFGLGANLYYIYPFLAVKSPIFYSAFFVGVALITGKRASVVTILTQFFLLNCAVIRRQKILGTLVTVILIAILFWVYQNTDVLSRFNWILEAEFDFTDPYFLSISGGGRFEEIFGIYDYFQRHPFDVLFGSPPGSYYIWAIEWSDGYTATKNYAHLTWIGYIFRYGLIFTVLLVVYFASCIYKNLGSRDPLFIAFCGIFVVSFFGALLITDPTAWILIALFLRVSRNPQGGTLSKGLPAQRRQLSI